MSDPQTLEEAWRNHGLALTSEELDDAARALALAALEEALTPLTYGQHFETREALIRRMQSARRTMKRRSEALGKLISSASITLPSTTQKYSACPPPYSRTG